MAKQIITSLLDTDLYKLTMQQAVLQLFPKSAVTYRFKNRGDQRFNADFLQKLQDQIFLMSSIQLTPEEYSWIKREIPFFKSLYIEYLKNYRFNPNEVMVSLGQDGDILLNIKGLWASTILWEVPLMAIISELYFREIDTEWRPSDVEVEVRAGDKMRDLQSAQCLYADFGTRRRRGFWVQDDVVGVMARAQKNAHFPCFIGTSNVYFAMKYNIKPIGTMAHEWFMGMSVLEGLYNANYFALENWVRVYHADLGIALTDTYSFDAFLKDFKMEWAKIYDGVRHDSGNPCFFADKIIEMYKGYGIDPLSKTIVFSDSLTTDKAIQIKAYCEGRIKVSFGIGTHFTNDFENSKALNMVIKMWSCAASERHRQIPVVKLSDENGKVMGDPDAVKVAKWMFFGEKL